MMGASYPVVTIIMPAYNQERFIEKAIRSVQEQTFADWALLVLDDGSVDGTCAIVERLAAEDERIELIRNEKNMGVARTRNCGLELSRGQYVAFLDSDDIWLPDKLEKQLSLAKETGADIIYCSYGIIDDKGKKSRRDYIVPESIDLNGLLKENVIGCSTVLLSERIAGKYRFETEFYHEDYVLWLRLLQDGYVAAGCRESLVKWRLSENSRSFNKRKSAQNRWRIYREAMRLSLWQSLWLFAHYAMASLRKYSRVAD